MFCQPRWTDAKGVRSIAKKGLGFLRVGINAGDSARAAPLVEEIKSCGVKARTSLMKAYALEPAELASEARALEEYGADAVTIMDSAGYMMPDDAARYVEVVAGEVSIPVGFHGHNNLGLSVANGLAAWRAGAASIDCGVMGMARSVGNIPTEVFIAVLQRLGEGTEYDLHSPAFPHRRGDRAADGGQVPQPHTPAPPRARHGGMPFAIPAGVQGSGGKARGEPLQADHGGFGRGQEDPVRGYDRLIREESRNAVIRAFNWRAMRKGPRNTPGPRTLNGMVPITSKAEAMRESVGKTGEPHFSFT